MGTLAVRSTTSSESKQSTKVGSARFMVVEVKNVLNAEPICQILFSVRAT